MNISVAEIENNLRFAGQYFDNETGLYYNWNRYYNPELGRYITADPAQEGLNLYTYVFNNPNAFVDPRGLCVDGLTWEQSKEFWLMHLKEVPDELWGGILELWNYPKEHPLQVALLLLFGQALYGPRTFDAIPPGYRISPYRLTQPGENYIRYESTRLPSRIAQGKVASGTYAGNLSNSIPNQTQLNNIYNLPAKDIPRDIYYTIQPKPGQWIVGPKPVSGGTGNEVQFLFETESYISGPFRVP